MRFSGFRYVVAAGVAALSAVTLNATPALADSGSLSGQICCDKGGAKVTAYATFKTRYRVVVNNIKLTDMCPADGYSVYVKFEYKQSGGDWVERGERRENHAGCGETTSETQYDFTATSGAIDDVRLKVCVDETWPNNDDCGYTNYRDNPYN